MQRFLRSDAIAAHGYYVVEDVETSYWRSGSGIYGYHTKESGFRGQCSFVEWTKQLVDVVNREFVGPVHGAPYSIVSDGVDLRVQWVQFSANLLVMKIATRK